MGIESLARRKVQLAALIAAGMCVHTAAAATVDFNFSISYSGMSITGRLIGLSLDANGNGTEVDPTSVLIFSAPASVGLPASPSNPYAFIPHTFERSTLFQGTFISTTPGVYGFQVSNYTISPPLQNLLMSDDGADVTLVFNFGASLGGEGGVATYGIMAEEDALWPAINTSVSFTAVLPGDLNSDGHVNGADLALMLGAWGTNSATSDLNHDGVVNATDLGTLLGAWTG
ncbi:MAG: dockerin type I domain-containing protein [Phycisphaerales bacterium]